MQIFHNKNKIQPKQDREELPMRSVQSVENRKLYIGESIKAEGTILPATETETLHFHEKHGRCKISRRMGLCIAFSAFMIVTIVTAVLVIYYNSPKSQRKQCQFDFRPKLNMRIQVASATRSVAVGDFNHDGLLDVVVANYGSDNIGVILGNGDGTFSRQTTYSTGALSRPYSVTVDDMNGDKQLDILVTNYGSNLLSIFFANSDGSFSSPIKIQLGSAKPLSVATGNFDNDPRIDMAVVNYATNSIGILLNFNNESFASMQTYFTGYDSDPRAIALSDFNGDHVQDIAVVNYGTNNMAVFIGNGDGTFQNLKIYPTGSGSHPYSLVSNDLNGDGILDIAVLNAGANSINIFSGLGNGTFIKQMTLPTGANSSPHSLVIADFNKDHFLDIIVANTAANNIGLFLGSGTGTFLNMKKYSLGDKSLPQCIAIGDFNNDNKTDVVLANNGSNSVGIVLNSRLVDFIYQRTYSVGNGSSEYTYDISLTDINNDSYLDIIVANHTDRYVGVFLNLGNGTFSTKLTLSTEHSAHPSAIAVDDVNKDGYKDVVVCNMFADNIGVWLGVGNGTFQNQQLFSTGSSSVPNAIATSDFNNDNNIDVVVANSGINTIGILLGFGNGSFMQQLTYATGSKPNSVAVGDLNNDKNIDVVVANFNSHTIGVFLGYGNGSFAAQVTYSAGELSYPFTVVVADLNNDNILDITSTRYARDMVIFFLGTGNGSFWYFDFYWTGAASLPMSCVVGDLNDDRIADVVVGNGNTYTTYPLVLLQGLGNEMFRKTFYLTNSTYSRNKVTAGDINKDGYIDLVIANSAEGNILIYMGYYAITLNVGNEFSTMIASIPSSIAVNDFNYDGLDDVAVTDYNMNLVYIALTYPNESLLLTQSISTGIGSRPQMVVAKDLNNDSIIDLAVANSGTDNIGVFIGNRNGSFQTMQSYVTGSQSTPTALATGYFNEDSRLDLVVANIDSSNIGVFNSFDIGTFTKLPSVTVYLLPMSSANRSLVTDDFNNDNIPDIIFVDGNNNNIGIVLGYRNGMYSSPVMYSFQRGTAPIFAAAGDFNNDKIKDIVVVNRGTNNMFILLGFGNGTFNSPITFSTGPSSGPRHIAVGDLNNDQFVDIVVANYGTGNIGIFFGIGNGTFRDLRTLSTGTSSRPNSVAIADLNNDKTLDIVVANWLASSIGIFVGVGNGTFSNQKTFSTGTSSFPIRVKTGDFNSDNCQDIVVLTSSDSGVKIFFGDCNGMFVNNLSAFIADSPQVTDLAVCDFNNDGSLDALVSCWYSNTIEVFYGDGHGGFVHRIRETDPSLFQPQRIVVGDFNNDKRLDIVTIDTFRILINYGFPYDSYLNMMPYSTGNNSFPSSVSVGDINSDKVLDIIVTNSGSNNIGFFLGTNLGKFKNQSVIFTGSQTSPMCAVLADLNNDTQLDIAVANKNAGNVGVFMGYGNGTFSSQAAYPLVANADPYWLAVGDVNDDGLQDIVVVSLYASRLSILFGFVDGSFGNIRDIPLGYGSMPSFVVLGNVTNDVYYDIIFVNSGYGNMEIYARNCYL